MRHISFFIVFFFILFFITKDINAQHKLVINDSVYYDINQKAYLKKRFCNGLIMSQFWLKNGRELKISSEVDKEAYVFDNEKSWCAFLKKNLDLPQKDVQGKLLVALYIDKSGHVLDKRVINSIPGCEECNNAALKLIEKLPKFNPAKYKEKRVNSLKYLFILFSLIDE